MPTASRRSARRAALAVGLALVLAGCSIGGGDDSRDVTVGHLTVEVPADWTETDAGGPWDTAFVGDGLKLQIAGTFSEDPTASAAYNRLDLPATTGLPGYESQGLHQPEVDVDGADTSMRTDFTYTDDGEAMEGTWVIAGQWPYPSTAAIAVTGSSVEDDVVESIIDSLQFTKTAGEDP